MYNNANSKLSKVSALESLVVRVFAFGISTSLKSIRLKKALIVLLTCFLALCPTLSYAVDGKPAKSSTVTHVKKNHSAVDISLNKDGQISGRILSKQGTALPNVEIQVISSKQASITGKTNATGDFQLGPLQGGLYIIHIGNELIPVRAWVAGTAPPSALSNLQFSLDQLTRGQSPVGEFFASDRFLLGVTIAGAIAIPAIVYGNRSYGLPSGS